MTYKPHSTSNTQQQRHWQKQGKLTKRSGHPRMPIYILIRPDIAVMVD